MPPITRVFERIYKVVRKIPCGRVMTYGAVAQAAGLPRGARIVGFAMRASHGALPWHRVLGLAKPGFAHITIKEPLGAAVQRRLLTKEGVKFGKEGRIDLETYGTSWNFT